MSNPCVHVHVSGRACTRKTLVTEGYCVAHLQDECKECADMLRVFPFRKHLEGGDTDGSL